MENLNNHKTNKDIRNKIFKRIKELHKQGTTYENIAKNLNSYGYRCCNGEEWKSKSVYDFFRRTTNKNSQINIKKVSINKSTALNALIECNIENSIKMEIIKKII